MRQESVKQRLRIIDAEYGFHLSDEEMDTTSKQESMEIIAKWLRVTDNELAYKTTIENSYTKPYAPRDAEIIYEFAQLESKKPIMVKWEDTYDNSFVKELDASGFIDKLFQGLTNVIREPVPYK